MSYTLSKTGAQIDAILNKADAAGIIQKSSATYAGIAAALALGSPVIIQDGADMYQYVGAIGPTMFFSQMSSIYNYIAGAYFKYLALTSQDVWSSGMMTLQNKLTFDATPTEDSSNPVTSDGIFKAIGEVEDDITDLTSTSQPGMTVGASENLISDTKISNSSPYLYRPVLSGVGNRAWQKLVGGTIANNQLVQNGNFADTSGWSATGGTFSVNNNVATLTASGGGNAYIYRSGNYGMKAGHKYIVAFIGKAASGKTLYISGINTNKSVTANGGWQEVSYIETGAANGYPRFGLYNPSASDAADITAVGITDLTQDFGSTIAEYAYTLEQGQAGAGIAWLKSYGFFSKYAPYDAGSLISTKAEKKKVVGKNRLDPSTLGLYDATGTSTMRYGFAPVTLTAGTYTLSKASGNAQVYVTNITDGYTFVGVNNWPYTFGLSKTSEIFVRTGAASSTGYDLVDVQLEKSATATAYVPYTSQEYDLGSDELRGLFKLDGNNNIYADGDIKTSDGVIQRNWKLVDLGSIDWTYYTAQSIPMFYGDISDGKVAPSGSPAHIYLCTKYIKASDDALSASDFSDYGYGYYAQNLNSGACRMLISDSAYTDASTFKTAMSGVYCLVELATPTTEQGTPFIDPSIVYPHGTEEYIDTRTVPVPVGNETEYSEDLKGGLETILDTPSANGTYVLKATVSGGVATLSWVSE